MSEENNEEIKRRPCEIKESIIIDNNFKMAIYFNAGIKSEGLINNKLVMCFIPKPALKEVSNFNEKLQNFGFTKNIQYSTDASLPAFELFPNPNKRIYMAYENMNKQSISEDTWKLLDKEFPDCFGPIIFDKNRNINGLLESVLEVKFQNNLSKKERIQLIQNYGGKEVYFKRDISKIIFKDLFGYAILGVAEKIHEEEEVMYVSNIFKTQVISH